MKGLYVWCFQKFPEAGLTDTPYKGKIHDEIGHYWLLAFGRNKTLFKANKGACSSVPFKNDAHVASEAYRNEIKRLLPGGTATVETPGGDVPAAPVKRPGTGSKRPGNRQDARGVGSVCATQAQRLRSRSRNSA